MTTEQKNALIEAIKEAGRYTVFLAISTFVSLLLEKLSNIPQDNTTIITLTLVLRFLDKYLHEKGKEETRGIMGEKGQPKGLLPF